MDRSIVYCSSICSIWYEEHVSLLEIEFHTGEIFQYVDVPEEEYEFLISANYHGEYFSENIKGIYSSREIG